jgi:hypothetical protein
MEKTAESRFESLKAEIAGLEADLAALSQVDPARLEEKALKPAKADITVMRQDVLWIS